MSLLEVKNLSFTYPDAPKSALCGLSFSVRAGQLVLLLGGTGSGKTTLLRLIKHLIAPIGKREGAILLGGSEVAALSKTKLASDVGYLFQHTQEQLCMPTPLEEMAFGLRQLGAPAEAVSRRCGELACYFGMDGFLDRPIDSLSGGELQLTALASILSLDPSLLLLDEPTAQLDPIHSRAFTEQLLRLCRENGRTVLAALHHPEELFFAADAVLILDEGKALFFGSPQDAADELGRRKHPLLNSLPAGCRLWARLKSAPSAGERKPTEAQKKSFRVSALPERTAKEEILRVKEITVEYPGAAQPVLKELSLSLHAGERFFLLGGNGSGKTTLLKTIAGLLPVRRGKLQLNGQTSSLWRPTAFENVGYLPQDVLEVFEADCLEEDFLSYAARLKKGPEEIEALLRQPLFRPLNAVRKQNPLDLSGGQRQLAALCKIMLGAPRVLLLDEPARGLDASSCAALGAWLSELSARGTAILLSCHDPDLAARFGDRCGFLFHGELLCPQSPGRFFPQNRFYRTSLQRYLSGEPADALLEEQITGEEEL